MIISNKYKFIFIHVGKTGGSTIRKRIEKLNEINEYKIEKLPYTLKHITISQISNSLKIHVFFKFAFCRNIYDKIYASFKEGIKQGNNKRNDDFNLYLKRCEKQLPTFEEYFSLDKTDNTQLHNRIKPPMHAWTHIDGKNMMDFIGRHERFEQDFQTICEILKLPHIQKENTNVRTKPIECSREESEKMPLHCYKYLNKYTRHSIEIVNEVYSKDFEYFNYPMLDPKDFPDELPPEPLRTEDVRTIN